MEQVFQEYVLEQKNKGKGVFLSSHIMSEVERLCDRVSIIRNGQIVETGTLDELRHLTRYTMKVATEQPIEQPVEALEKIGGAYDIEVMGTHESNALKFSVDMAKMGEVVAFLNNFGIVKLQSMPPSLEDLFMSHYADSEGDNDEKAGGDA
jgi:ABC-2 type transport system ATP-binding protein